MKLKVALLALAFAVSASAQEKPTPQELISIQCLNKFRAEYWAQCEVLMGNEYDEEAFTVCQDTFTHPGDLIKCWKTIAGMRFPPGVPRLCKARSVIYSELYDCFAENKLN